LHGNGYSQCKDWSIEVYAKILLISTGAERVTLRAVTRWEKVIPSARALAPNCCEVGSR